jgi:hypothetical protein
MLVPLIYSSYGRSIYWVLSYSLQSPPPFVKACELVIEISNKLLRNLEVRHKVGARVTFTPPQIIYYFQVKVVQILVSTCGVM